MADISHPNIREPFLMSLLPRLAHYEKDQSGQNERNPRDASSYMNCTNITSAILHPGPVSPIFPPPPSPPSIPPLQRITALKPQIAKFHGPNWPERPANQRL